jgi:hypothetical protein
MALLSILRLAFLSGGISSFGVLGFDYLLWKWSIFHVGTRISAGQGKGTKTRKIPGNYTKDERKWKASIIFAVFKALAGTTNL